MNSEYLTSMIKFLVEFSLRSNFEQSLADLLANLAKMGLFIYSIVLDRSLFNEK